MANNGQIQVMQSNNATNKCHKCIKSGASTYCSDKAKRRKKKQNMASQRQKYKTMSRAALYVTEMRRKGGAI